MINCWEEHKCGREPGGKNVEELGVCPAATDASCHGINRGRNGGRICWAVTGTFCRGKVQGIFALKIESCLKCDFFHRVAQEEDQEFTLRPNDALYSTPSLSEEEVETDPLDDPTPQSPSGKEMLPPR